MSDSGLPVIAGLAIGIVFVMLFAMTLRLDNTLSDEELIAKYSKLPEIHYFLEKHPDAKFDVAHMPLENALMVSFNVEKQVEPASELFSGINILTVSAYNQKLTHVTLSVECGRDGFTVGVGLADVSGIDAAEEWCFKTVDRNTGTFEPDKTIYQFAFKPESLG